MSALLRSWGRNESPDAFENLLAPHIEHLYHLAYRFTGNTTSAEDLLQDVLIKVFSKSDALRTYDNPGAWMARVMYHEYVDEWRRSRHQPKPWSTLVDEELDSVERVPDDTLRANPERQVANTELRNRLVAGLARLNADQRAILVLHDVEEYTLEECAAIISEPIGTCKSRVFRARARLRGFLGGPYSRWKNDEPAATLT